MAGTNWHKMGMVFQYSALFDFFDSWVKMLLLDCASILDKSESEIQGI